MKRSAWTGLAFACALGAQDPNPTQTSNQNAPLNEGSAPIYEVNVVARTTKAVNYGHRSMPTKIGFAGTVFLPEAQGEARIKTNKGAVEIRAKFKSLDPPHRFGRQYLTYVLWAVTPEGRATNLGEILANGSNKGKLRTATELQSFALIVTAEPYYAVTQPSDVVVMENVIRPDTLGRTQTVDAKYELLKRGHYTLDLSQAKQSERTAEKKVPMRQYESLLELYQARNAVQFAKAQGAAQYAAQTIDKAERKLAQAEAYYARKPKSETVVTLAREATQTAEDARLIALRKRKSAEPGASHSSARKSFEQSNIQ